MIKKLLKTLVKSSGYEIKKISHSINKEGIPKDITDPDFIKYFNICKNYSVCSIEPMYALYKSIEYVIKNKIDGDFVEYLKAEVQ